MKKLTPTLFLLFLSLCIYGQSPEKMSYQAVIRDASNTLVTNQSIGMQISILQTTITGTTVYAETHTVTTNLNGLVSLEIGTGSTSDTFSTIDWSAGPYFIKTETDPTGGSSYTITGTSQLMSVPFAMYAKSSGNGITTDQSDAIVANTAKVGYADALVSANTDVAANTAKVGYTEAAVSANTDVAANTAKVGYTEAAVAANTDVAANTAKVGYTDAAVSANTDVAANTAKVGYTDAAVSANTDVAANTAKVGYTEAAVSANTDVAANTAKVGYTEALVSANTDVVANTAKTGITTDQSDAIVANTAKTGITSDQSDVIVANTAKTGITTDQSDAIVANTAKTGITTDQSDAIVANTAKTGITSDQSDAIVANTAKTGITSDQSDAIVANTAKTGITSDQSDAIVANTAKTGITSDQSDAIVANTAKTGITTDQSDAVVANTAKVGYTEAAVSANTDVAANTAKYSKNEVDALIANLQSQINNLVVGFGVGDFYGGGVVFYIFESGDTGYVAGETHGLIAAVKDQSYGIRWYNGSYTTTGATATTIGTGSANTDAIIAAQGAIETSYAAGVARAYTGGGFTDWFLPSKDELNKMYLNRATINTTASANGGSNFSTYFYRSSTEYDTNFAWSQYFASGNQGRYSKGYTYRVRAVRAF